MIRNQLISTVHTFEGKNMEEKSLSELIQPATTPIGVVRTRTTTKTNEDGSVTEEKEFECNPSKKGAGTGAVIGLALAGPVGALIGGTLGAIFGPED
ncbi:DUF456 domain-containing protein [Acinetobacter lwoffii]|uniref:DUF456 domain-containing protein n=1 Tax=Acinetobacter lwoffii TaxID=28090 RepID=UPI002097394D|nr:DUF456 domain-containing protein [Acinetobacter lwoffii]MCO8071752.1 DUF456 domain-containing protein [Acinetobacter lwoffii]